MTPQPTLTEIRHSGLRHHLCDSEALRPATDAWVADRIHHYAHLAGVAPVAAFTDPPRPPVAASPPTAGARPTGPPAGASSTSTQPGAAPEPPPSWSPHTRSATSNGPRPATAASSSATFRPSSQPRPPLTPAGGLSRPCRTSPEVRPAEESRAIRVRPGRLQALMGDPDGWFARSSAAPGSRRLVDLGGGAEAGRPAGSAGACLQRSQIRGDGP